MCVQFEKSKSLQQTSHTLINKALHSESSEQSVSGGSGDKPLKSITALIMKFVKKNILWHYLKIVEPVSFD